MEDLNEVNKLIAERLNHLEELKESGIDPFGSKYEVENKAEDILDNFEEYEDEKS